jgi:hypothetical protein
VSDADGVLLLEMVERGSARLLWSQHHALKGAAGGNAWFSFALGRQA